MSEEQPKKGGAAFGVLAVLVGLLVVCGGVLSAGAGGVWMYYSRQQAEEQRQKAVVEAAKAAALAEEERKASAEAFLVQARSAYDEGRYDQAMTLLDELVTQDPNHVEGWILHGRTLIKLKDPEGAMKDFSRAIGIDEKRTDALDYRAFLYIQRQMYDDAIADLEKILTLDPNNGRAYKLRSDCRFQQGDMKKAREDAVKSCELGYEDGCIAQRRLHAD